MMAGLLMPVVAISAWLLWAARCWSAYVNSTDICTLKPYCAAWFETFQIGAETTPRDAVMRTTLSAPRARPTIAAAPRDPRADFKNWALLQWGRDPPRFCSCDIVPCSAREGKTAQPNLTWNTRTNEPGAASRGSHVRCG